jgi:hypothetical protein
MLSTAKAHPLRRVDPRAVRTPQEAAARHSLHAAPGYLDVQRAKAALWLLGEINGGQLGFDVDDPAELDLRD